MKQDTLLLIDGFNLLSRSYFATSYNKNEDQLTKTESGIYTNALKVFFQKVFILIKKYNVTHLVIAWDVKKEELDRRKKYLYYKATRKDLPYPLIQQYETLKNILNNIGIVQLEKSPYEADDIIGTLTLKWTNNNYGRCLIYSNDKDLFQLLNSHTTQIISKNKTEILYTIDQFKLDYEINPKQWVDIKALIGDPTDNIPGCSGVGEKSAFPLIRQYNSIENLYENINNLEEKYNRYKKKLSEGKENVILSKELATIYCDINDYSSLNFSDFKLNIREEILFNLLAELKVKIKV